MLGANGSYASATRVLMPLFRVLVCWHCDVFSFSQWYYRHTHLLGVEEGPKQRMRRYLARQQSNYAARLADTQMRVAATKRVGMPHSADEPPPSLSEGCHS